MATNQKLFPLSHQPDTHPHGERARTVGEGALVLEELQVNFADVVLQVEGGGEVGLAVVSGTRQHRFMGSVDPFVPPQSVHLLEHLLARAARMCGWKTVGINTTRS